MTLTVLVCDAASAVDGLQVEAAVEIGLSLDATTDATRVAELAARLRPDVVICRLDMEGSHGVEVLTRVAASSPPSQTIARIAPSDSRRAADAIAAGASGLSSVDDDPRTVLAIATAVAGGSVAMSPAISASLARELSAATDSSAYLAGELDELRASIAQGTSANADFLSNISHELRTPVTVAKGIAYVLRNPAIEEAERTEFLEQLQGSLDKLMGIVDEIITISELERGTFELVLAPSCFVSSMAPGRRIRTCRSSPRSVRPSRRSPTRRASRAWSRSSSTTRAATHPRALPSRSRLGT